jgi:hypothetical protein
MFLGQQFGALVGRIRDCRADIGRVVHSAGGSREILRIEA